MANAKKNTNPPAKKTASADKKSGGAAAKNTKKTDTEPAKKQKRSYDSTRPIHTVIQYLFVLCAILFFVCLLFGDGAVGGLFKRLILGLFGISGWLFPLLLVCHAIYWKRDVESGDFILKFVFGAMFLASLSTFTQILAKSIQTIDIAALYTSGAANFGSGIIGGVLGITLVSAFGTAGALVINIAALLVFAMFFFGLTPRAIWLFICYRYTRFKEAREERRAQDAENAEEYADEDDVPEEIPADETSLEAPPWQAEPQEAEPQEAGFEPNVDIADAPVNPDAIDNTDAGVNASIYTPDGKINLGAIFTNDEKDTPPWEENDISLEGDAPEENPSIEIEKSAVETEKPEQIKKPREYTFPPITLLTPAMKQNVQDATAELQTTADKLVATLKSFNVNTRIVNVSRGPTITRYELMPEAGTRVRAIANLSDDIALNLAATGIRIEAPIPGKQAVGIEVPNKIVATVHLRELIEDKKFAANPSKVNVCLGRDVAGEPIYFDITKMPHLLIAGATGMGKSVCINSIITSILYKAKPEEVKLILIDPKKVEFNVYNGVPHLQTPVVSDPKKAAGALHWAVTEMERRYTLIEEANVRNIANYNELAKNTPDMEILPLTVIVIDELADLMMTAPDAVEDSICRLAQKARAAGMHLIIGTQRPSVDVITGLIKSNIPSRIAFTVASQVDSRTIIDIAGAEKLIGRGDMLYNPVGCAKPLRVQGAFVSEDEVEKIISFIKSNAEEPEYDKEIIESIEREAQSIGEGGKKIVDTEAGGASDEKLREAVEVGLDGGGKLSTSLLQRRLQIGYGRAAKIIDILQARGIVSEPDGQKPRELLITRQQYMEMVVSHDDRLS